MENDYLNMLAQVVLPAQILEYFAIVGVEQTATEIHISLDEKMTPELQEDVHFEVQSKNRGDNFSDWK